MSVVRIFILGSILNPCLGVDPISAAVAVGAAAFSKAGKLFCSTGLLECCNERYIKLDVQGLERDLKENLHGQHLVIPIIINAVKGHVADRDPKKPLVLSFHGWTGGGKSFVSQMIVKHLYERGEQSDFAHFLYSDLHFKHPSRVEEYKDQLHSWIYHNVSNCERSVFIFDEMDHMPEGMIDVLVPFLGHNLRIDGVNFRKSIFIFISNIGGDVLTQKAKGQWDSGKLREDLKLRDLQKPLEMSAYNLLSGLKGSDIIQKQLIDHFVPFLPLEKIHVRRCVEDEFKRAGVFNVSNEALDSVLDELDWWPEKDKLYSKSGCTKVTHKTRLIHGL
uniref:torsin-1A-like n=1 Tax=Styela clava TaxID=7725 RepID=UPI001939C7E2|nr:torsin-1A-like [Styela clava]